MVIALYLKKKKKNQPVAPQPAIPTNDLGDANSDAEAAHAQARALSEGQDEAEEDDDGMERIDLDEEDQPSEINQSWAVWKSTSFYFFLLYFYLKNNFPTFLNMYQW